jgi:hypothetical protein
MMAKRIIVALVAGLGLLASPGTAALAYDSGPEHRHSHAPQAVQNLKHGPGADQAAREVGETVRPRDETP